MTIVEVRATTNIHNKKQTKINKEKQRIKAKRVIMGSHTGIGVAERNKQAHNHIRIPAITKSITIE